MMVPRRIRILGVHRYVPTPEVYQDTLTTLFGPQIDPAQREQMAEHFERLHLIEIDVQPAGDEPDWAEITQPVAGLDRSSWQAPFDAQPLDEQKRRWVFFFHFLDLNQPLQSPCGNLPLPAVTPLPGHLAEITYCFP